MPDRFNARQFNGLPEVRLIRHLAECFHFFTFLNCWQRQGLRLTRGRYSAFAFRHAAISFSALHPDRAEGKLLLKQYEISRIMPFVCLSL